ncbi:MAG: hypothetical protein ACYTF6_12195, partial [Planctomycetota bacterium]
SELLPRPQEVIEQDGSPCDLYKAWPPGYDELPRLELAAVFYKIHHTEDTEGTERDWLVLFAWQARKTGLAGIDRSYITAAIVFLVLLLAVICFVFIKRLVRKSADERMSRRRSYRPLRGETEAAEQAEVDPELKAAVEKYRKEKETEHGQDSES